MRTTLTFGLMLSVLACPSWAQDATQKPSTPQQRAVAFLAREVAAWPKKNKCYSCHNNGDAARALYAAGRRSIPFEQKSLNATNRWLAAPEKWKDNGPKVQFSDKKLATIQFAFALAAAVEAGVVKKKAALVRAAEMVRDYQQKDGSWKVDADALAGSPVTYGRTLATVVARRTLATAEKERFAPAIQRAEKWLRLQRPRGVLDSAAVLIGLESMTGRELTKQRRHCLNVVRKGQSRDGGWGPYVNSPPEVFDTAIVLLGLATIGEAAGVREMTRRGREYLAKSQLPDGSWPETTRPSGEESYAQRISTSAWATLALLEAQAGDKRGGKRPK